MSSLADSVRRFCLSAGLRMNTDLGQHFLIDETTLDAIVDAASVRHDDLVVEIGAGIGILTKRLIGQAGRVIAIELDRRLIPLIGKYTGTESSDTSLSVIHANALHVPFPDEPYKIVANIPYHITSPLLRHAFLESGRPPVSLTLLIQREVAEKICDERDRSLLSIIVGLFGSPRIVRRVPPDNFLPPPKVDSAVLHIDCFAAPKAERDVIEAVFTLTKHAFSQKRKMLRNTMQSLPGAMEALERSGIDAVRRPQTLSVEEWVEVAEKWMRA